MLIVIDTNILVSALLSPDSTAFTFLSGVMDGKHTVLICEEVFKEYMDVLHRDKFGFDDEFVSWLLNWFKDNAIWIEPKPSTESVPDEKDRVFYDLAKACRARLVTGNIKHYPIDELITALRECT